MRLPFLHAYSRIEYHDKREEDDDDIETRISSDHKAQYRRLERRLLTLQVGVAILVLACVFLVFHTQTGTLATQLPITNDDLLAPAGNIRQTWHYQKIYSKEPDIESEAAWGAIFPKEGGFVHDERLAPNISNIAVFHGLHCLHGIRGAYYKAIAGRIVETIPVSEEVAQAKVDTLVEDDSIHHIRHCFDYLRQSLMCAADTNLEAVDWELGGVTGWGTERQCRDFDAVIQWADRHRPESLMHVR